MTRSILDDLVADADSAHAAAFAALAAEVYAAGRNRAIAPPRPLSTAAVTALFDEPPPESGRPLADVIDRVRRDVIPNAVWLHDPMHMGHQLSAPVPAAVWTEPLISSLNPSHAVAELSPATTAIEKRVVRWLCDLAGLPATAGGTFTVGATEATFTALLAARARLWPDAWQRGIAGREAVVYCGEHAHYSVARAVAELGLGGDACIRLPLDAERRLDTDELRRRVAAERRPVLAIVGIAGSTSVGAFDDLDAIADVCDEAMIWLHVDGAHGASATLSDRHRPLVRGLHRATSIAWDSHKMLSMPLAAGALLVRDEGDLDAAFAQHAEYLFHDRADRPYDQGVRSFQCSRRADALKVWVAWQRYGTRGLAHLYDRLCATTRSIHDAVVVHPRFEALHEPACNILCFRHVAVPADRLRPDWNASGEGWITLTTLDGEPALRITVMNPLTTPADGERMLAGLDRLAQATQRAGARG